eukprot:8110458-Prorocentrum_lima.AAC.1
MRVGLVAPARAESKPSSVEATINNDTVVPTVNKDAVVPTVKNDTVVPTVSQLRKLIHRGKVNYPGNKR